MPPTMLINSLEALRRKVKLLGVAYGAGIALAVAVAAFVGTTLLDYLLNLHAVPRLIVALVGLAAIAHVLWWKVIHPAMGRISLSDIAGKLENAFPQFDDRLRSTIDFLGGRDSSSSDMMKQRVVTETSTLASNLDLNRAIIATPAWYSLAGGMGALCALVLLFSVVLSPAYRNIALARLFSPFAEHAWPKRVRIDVLGDLPPRVPVGQRLDVRMKLGKGDSSSAKAIVFYQYGDGPVMQEFMTRGADGTYQASLDTRVDQAGAQNAATTGAMKIWMKSGDDERQLTPVTVVPRLSIKSVEALVKPPAYVPKQLQSTINLAAAPAVMAFGSSVELRITFNKPLAQGADPKLVAMDDPNKSFGGQIKWTHIDDHTANGAWTASESMRFRIVATDVDQFQNSALEEYELIVRPDQSPTVQIEQPRRNEERTPVAQIPLQGIAEDDYGIKSLKLVVDRVSGQDKRHWEIPLVTDEQPASAEVSWSRADGAGNASNTDRLRFRTNYNWNLSALEKADLKPGDVLEYYLEARDSFLLDGQTHDPVASGKLRISIISQDDLTNRVVEELRQTKEQIGAVMNGQKRNQQETSNLQKETKDKPNLDQADRAAADRITDQQATAAAQTKTLAGRMDAIQKKLDENKSPSQELKELARDVKDDLNRAAEGAMKDATSKLSSTQQPDQKKDERNEALDNAQKEQQKAADQLQQAMDRMSNIGSLSQTIERIAAILAEQKETTKQTQEAGKDNLGKRPEDMKPEDRKKLQDAADKQAALAEKMNKATDEMKRMAEQMSKSDPTAAQAMEKAQRTAAQQQVQSKQQQAAQQAKQNQQAAAQNNQKAAELGLEMMLNELREADKARLAQLSKKLEELQKQIQNLIRRQSGHNIDNLSIQGPKVFTAVKPEAMAELMLKAERDPGKEQPKVEVGGLSQGQEQTRTNTRDIGKQAEAMPNGAESAAHLVRAAGKMERALFSLRDSKLPEAYDPSQVEALAALEAAKKIVDEQKAAIDEQQASNDREAVRARYVKIKEDQERLNVETARIDAARDPQSHELPRTDAVKLGGMPGQQGKLADEVQKIDKDLAEIGAIVYTWANKDISTAMNGVKQELGKPETGARTQSQQKRIVQQLDEMIKNLATKPKESKFAQDGKGGGGGGQQGGGPKLPAEAELRLLKSLQNDVNQTTKDIDADAQARADKGQTLTVGTRQGELRNLLDQLIQRSSSGESKLGPEPDKTQQLPEEATDRDIENQELEKGLLQDKPDADKGDKQSQLIGDRMARSRQRLALNHDPGKTTQKIQERIIVDIDDLIQQAREQQAETRNSEPKQGKPGEQMPQPGQQQQQQKPDNNGKPQQAKTNAGSNPAQEKRPGASPTQTDLSRNIEATAREWGAISPRVRDAAIEGSDDEVIEEYRKLVEDYWKSLATKAKDR